MADQERVHYRVDGGEALKIIEAFVADQDVVLKSWHEFATQHGSGLFYHDVRLFGLVFDAPPDGWMWAGIHGWPEDACVPNRQTRTGRSAAAAMDRLLPKLTGLDLARRLGCNGAIQEHGKALWPAFAGIGDAWVLSMPISIDGEHHQPPGDCTRLRMSEYWAMKEAVEAAKMEAAQ